MAKIVRKKKGQTSFIPSATKEVTVVPKDLQDQLGAIEAVATAFNVLDKGSFPHSYLASVKASLQFLAKLHEQTVEGALKHPQAHMSSELKALLKAKPEAVQEPVADEPVLDGAVVIEGEDLTAVREEEVAHAPV